MLEHNGEVLMMLTQELDGVVSLADGSEVDLRPLSHEELLTLQWDQEREFARDILAAPAGSLERAETTRRAYDAVTRIFAAAAGLSGKPLRMGLDPRYERLVLALLDRQRRRGLPVRFFEIGFGGGLLLARVRDAGYAVEGIEVSEAMRDDACRLLGPDAAEHLYRGGLLDFEPSQLEGPPSLIYWNDVLEHVPPDEAAAYLRRIAEMLLPGGTLVTITPNWHIRPSDVTSAFCPPRTEAAGVHLKEYTLRQLTQLLRAAGFDRVATPWVVTPRHILLCRRGMASLKRLFEPTLEWMPFRLARLLCRGLGLSITIASKSRPRGM
jgi:SAM-dependent methyltransferase